MKRMESKRPVKQAWEAKIHTKRDKMGEEITRNAGNMLRKILKEKRKTWSEATQSVF